MRAIKYIFLTLPFVLFCCQRPSQATSITQEEVIPTDTIAQIPLDSVERLINEPSREKITFTMDSLWKYHDLNLATYEILKNTLQYLEQEQKPSAIDPNTRITMEYYKELILIEKLIYF